MCIRDSNMDIYDNKVKTLRVANHNPITLQASFQVPTTVKAAIQEI